MEEILTRLGYSLEKKLNVGEDLIIWDNVISYLSKIIGLKKRINSSNLSKRYTNHEALYFVNDDFLNIILKREFQRIEWKYRNAQSQRPEMATKLTLLANIIETIFYYSNHQKVIKNNNVITASDIAMFSFCPASYSIHKSYEIKDTLSTKTGTQFHEETKLINLIKNGIIKKKNETDERYFSDKEYKRFLHDIDNSQLIYSGHSEKDKSKFFKNKDFVCQPDYIFRNSAGKYFVVEEKFRFVQKKWVEKTEPIYDQTYYTSEDKANNIFYANHCLQLAAYIYGIDEIQIEYGYLIYWQLKKGKEAEFRCIAKKIERENSLLESLRATYVQVAGFNLKKVIGFDVQQLNINKCTNCSVAGLCGHKHKAFLNLKMPYYEGKYMSLRKYEIPSTLTEYKEEFVHFLSPDYQCQVCHNWVIGSNISEMTLVVRDSHNGYRFQNTDTPAKIDYQIDLQDLMPFQLNIGWDKRYYYSNTDYLMRHTFKLQKICGSCRRQESIPLEFKFVDEKLSVFKKIKLTDFNKSEMKRNRISYQIDKRARNIILICELCKNKWEPRINYRTNLLTEDSPKCPQCGIGNILITLEKK